MYDGNVLTPVRNPDAGGGFAAPIEFKGKIWFRYATAKHMNQLAVYDGASIRIVDPPSPGDYIEEIAPIVYRDHLYLGYGRSGGRSRLVEFDGTTMSYVGAPDTSWQYAGQPIVYHDKLYFTGGHGRRQLARLDGSVVTPIANPDGMLDTDSYCNASCMPSSGVGNPFMANDRLYMTYTVGLATVGFTRQGPGGDGDMLAYLNESGATRTPVVIAPPAAGASATPGPGAAPADMGPAANTAVATAPPARGKASTITHDGDRWTVSFDDESGKRQTTRVVRPDIVNFTPQIWGNLNTQHAGQGMWLAPAGGGLVRIVDVATKGQGPGATVEQVTVTQPMSMADVVQFVSRYGFQLIPGAAPQ